MRILIAFFEDDKEETIREVLAGYCNFQSFPWTQEVVQEAEVNNGPFGNVAWSQEDITFLMEHSNSMTRGEIATHLNRSERSVENKLHSLRKKLNSASAKPQVFWTLDELDFVRKNHHLLSIQEIARRLGRSHASVKAKVSVVNSHMSWGQDWPKAEEMLRAGVSVGQVAKAVNRSMGAVYQKAFAEGISIKGVRS